MIARLCALALLAAAPAALPAVATAQETPAGPVLSLWQISVALSASDDEAASTVKVRTLKEAAAGITSCAQVDDVAARIGATVERNDVAWSALPPPVQKLLTDLPLGKASAMFGQQKEYARVLVVCSRSGG